MSLFKSTFVIAFFTLLSRVSGLLRDLLMANLVGASFLSDAFFVAFKLPNFFRRLFAEGAFNAAFVPSFAGLLSAEGRKAAVHFATEVMSVLLVVLLILNAVFIVFMPFILPVIAPGFAAEPEKFDLTVTLSRICFPYILFISLVSLLAGMLNSLGKFAAPAAAPILLNLAMVAALLTLPDLTPTPAHAAAIGVFLAGLLQLLWLILACRRENALPGITAPRLTKQVKSMLLLMAPAAIGSSVQQLNLLIDTWFASRIDDAVSYLYYADRLTELPIGMIGVAVATALLPLMSKQIQEGKRTAAQFSMNRALEIILLFGLPATAALLVIAEPIIRVLYQHGEFTSADTTATYRALMAFAIGLPAFLIVKIFAPGFYANKDTKTPFKIAVFCVLVNLLLNVVLIRFLAHVGMALATSLASWVNCLLLGTILYRRGIFRPDATLKRRLARLGLATKAMALLLLGCGLLFGTYDDHTKLKETVILAVTIAIGGSAYLALAWFGGGIDRQQVMGMLKRKPASQTPPDELEA